MNKNLSLPPIPVTRERFHVGLVTIEESRDLDRWSANAWHMGRVAEWIHDGMWLRHGTPTPDDISAIEQTLVGTLEANIIARWGVQAVLF